MKKVINLLFLFLLIITGLTGTLAYTLKFPLCNSTVNDSCINYTSVSPITNAPKAIMYWDESGNLYLTNDTPTVYINNYTYLQYVNLTNITYQVTNITNLYYNASNGSNIILSVNVTANETFVREWLVNLYSNFSNIYNRSEIENRFAFKDDLNGIRNIFNNYTLTVDTKVDNLYSNISSLNITRMNEFMDDNGSFSTTWKVIVIINCILMVAIILFLIRNMMEG